MENISEITNAALKGDVLAHLSVQLHENPSAVRRGLEYAVPASIAGLNSYAASESRAEDLLASLRSGDYPHVSEREVHDVVEDPAATARLAQSSGGFIGRMFGDRQTAVVDAIADHAGLSRAGASTVLGLATPLVLERVGKETADRDLDARGLSRFLAEQKHGAFGSLPARIALALGGEDAMGATSSRALHPPHTEVGPLHDVHERATPPKRELLRRVYPRHGMAWKLALLTVLAFTALFLIGHSNAPRQFSSANVPQKHHRDKRLPQQYGPGQLAQPQLPSISATPTDDDKNAGDPTKSISQQTGVGPLVAVLDGAQALPKRYVLEQSDATISKVADVLKAHPTAKVRLDGFADQTGDFVRNAARSQARAERVKKALVDRGVASQQIATAGEGSDRPLATNDTAEGRARNLRVELVVTAR